MTNDAERHIECFDLHICQCAIRCQVIEGMRFYEFMMTAACAEAATHGRAHATPLHRAFAHERRLAARLLKYSRRGLRVEPPDPEILHVARVDDPPVPFLHSFWCGGHKWHQAQESYWVINVKDKKFLSSASLASSWTGPMSGPFGCSVGSVIPPNCPTSEPAIYYPCRRTRSNFNSLAYTKESVHWLIRTHAGPSYPVSLLGGGRVWCNTLIPLYLVQNMELSHADIVARVRKELPCVNVDETKGLECYVLRCPYPFTCLTCVKDWEYLVEDTGSNAPSSYGPIRSALLETRSPCTIKTVMYCADTLTPCKSCLHADAAPLQVT